MPVNSEKIKYFVMSQHRNHNVKTLNKPFEVVGYLGTRVANENYIQEGN